MTFLPRITFPTADTYVRAANAGLLNPGQYVRFEDIDARFGGSFGCGAQVTTFCWSTGATKAARRWYPEPRGRSVRLAA